MIEFHPNDIIIAAFAEVPEHLFRVEEVYDACICLMSGPIQPNLSHWP